MIDVTFATLWLLISIFLHIILNKFRLYLHIKSFATYIVFLVGLVGYRLSAPMTNDLPVTTYLFYISCTIAYVGITGGPILGNASPTTSLLMFLKSKRTRRAILRYMARQNDIALRHNALLASGWVRQKGNRLYITPQGKIIATTLLIYRNLLRIKEGG